ncbi:MAG: hypothetical protein ACOX1P_21770 [Thermoguttaceae bacterium]|jgi:hypothetical protein
MVRIDGDGWKEALGEYGRTRDALYQGRVPRPKAEGVTIKDACNAYRTSKLRLLEAGELSPRTFADSQPARIVTTELRRHAGTLDTPNPRRAKS